MIRVRNSHGRYSVCEDGVWWSPSFDSERWAASLVEYALYVDALPDDALELGAAS